MRLSILVFLAALGIAAATIFFASRPFVGEGRIVDELGEVHKVVYAGPYVIIKHEPARHMVEGKDFEKMMAYVKARRESWRRWSALLEKYGDEVYVGYVVPCRILTLEEFIELAKRLSLEGKIVKVVFYRYWKNGTYEGAGIAGIGEDEDLEKRLRWERIQNMVTVGIYLMFLQGRFDPSTFNETEAAMLGEAHVDVYVGAFVVKASLKELRELSQREEILMVDTPLDLIWRFRERGLIVEVRRTSYGDIYLVEKKNLCTPSK